MTDRVAVVVGDSVWTCSPRVGRGPWVSGYSLEDAGRMNSSPPVHEHPADLLRHLDEVNVRRSD